MDNYLDQFEMAHMAGTMSADALSEWSDLGNALLDAEEANKALADANIAAAESELAFHEDILKRIEAAYSGSLNYMNSLEKAEVLEDIAKIKLASGDTQGYFDTLYKQLEFEKKTATTREDYSLSFDQYIAELQGAEYEPKTTDDVVNTLESILEQNERIESAIATASYQAPII